jgi:hypothetical protein
MAQVIRVQMQGPKFKLQYLQKKEKKRAILITFLSLGSMGPQDRIPWLGCRHSVSLLKPYVHVIEEFYTAVRFPNNNWQCTKLTHKTHSHSWVLVSHSWVLVTHTCKS